ARCSTVATFTPARAGLTEIPKFRISPDYEAKRHDPDTWQSGQNGGQLGLTDLLLRAHVMPTYLSKDWGRDWGSLRAFATVVDATPADIQYGSTVHSGLWKPGKIRIGP
ncbi:arabinosyltransferase C-terminal domain-containing protein, partial [Mycobacteroides abscessus subsp. abscessus]|uniref:arabinosyltransferase C-terminal domain-containing protein n=1 Tax=Mycobacteroides abscessus TaxID=36809 RepID=UPI003CF9E77D